MSNKKKKQKTQPKRELCDCQATLHPLVGNCLVCGKIVCEQEGSGLCLFCCSGMVGKCNEPSFTNFLISDEALQQKNKILQFDREKEKRTIVIDDENDYFQVDNRWISNEERNKFQNLEKRFNEEKEKLKRATFISIDLTNKSIKTENPLSQFNEVQFINEAIKEEAKEINLNQFKDIINPSSNPFLKTKPFYISKRFIEENNTKQTFQKDTETYRLQDNELMKLHDEGKCLSLHQPWASLLVSGIKTVEGRSWYTNHRGRLWIASTSQIPTELTIQQVQSQYQNTTKTFPSDYPVGCLLGCVDLVDVLLNDDYNQKYKEKETQSEYIFVVDNPKSLLIKFKITGNHKIWKLTPEQMKSAQFGLCLTNE